MVLDAFIKAKGKSTLFYYKNSSRALSELYLEQYGGFFMEIFGLVLENENLAFR